MIRTVSFRDALADEALMCEWQSGMRATDNLYAMYQSIDWISTMTDAGSVSVFVKEGSAGRCIVPLAPTPVRLKFSLSRSFQPSLTIRCLELLGGEPIGEIQSEALVEVVEAIWKSHSGIDAIYMKSVMQSSPLWAVLEQQQWKVGNTHAYKPDGERPFHYLVLPETFDAYLGQFRKKQRYNLRRQVRVLAEAHSNNLELDRVQRAQEVDSLIESVNAVTERSWKAAKLTRAVPEVLETPERLAALAEQGLLRSYVLKVNGAPCAYVVGYLYNDIYHYANIGYDSGLASYSPGNVLLFLVIEDLIDNAHAKFMNFGISDAEYKRIFGNRHIKDASLLLMRPSASNSIRRGLHRGFSAAKEKTKQLVAARAERVRTHAFGKENALRGLLATVGRGT